LRTRPSKIGTNVLNNSNGSFSPPVRILATRRRRRTVAARLRSGVLELMVPESMPQAERERWAEAMRKRLERRLKRSLPTDERLERRARALNERLFGGMLRWTSIGFGEMKNQWASCAFTVGEIRVANRAARLPDWVIDYLLVHELAHLRHSDHGAGFHEMANRYELTERAKGYLMALDHAAAEVDA
jgi:predicted metal-dependent hydrolase